MTDLSSLDRSAFLFLNSFHASWLNSFMLTLSGQAVWIPFIGYFLWLSFKQHGKLSTGHFLLFLVLALVASDVTSSYIIKNSFDRLRPCRLSELKPLIYSFGQKCGGKYGFVSSHAANAFNLVFFSVQCLKMKTHWKAFLWLFSVAIAFSRIYLGVHYPGDILGGIGVGLVWGYFFSWGFRNIQGASLPRTHAPVTHS